MEPHNPKPTLDALKNHQNKNNKLTPKQKAFADNYIIDFNGKQAAIKCGYSSKTAEVQASRLLSNVKVQGYIRKKIDKIAAKAESTGEFVISELLKIAKINIKDLVIEDKNGNIKLNPTADGTLIQQISKTANGLNIKTMDRLKALELLGKYHSLFTDKIEHTGSLPVKIIINKDVMKDGIGTNK